MHLLLTRAGADAARTGAALVEAGHEVSVSPVIAIVGTGARGPPGVVDALLATSAHAFSCLGDWPTPEARRLMPLMLVGWRTAAVARARGFVGRSVVAATATDLAVAVLDAVPKGRRLVYVAGRDRKPELEAALATLGRTPEVVEVYEARPVGALEPAVVAALRAGRIEGALHFSRRSAGLFLDLAMGQGIDVGGLAHFCLSEDVALPLREAGCGRVTVAGTPNEPALLALIEGPALIEGLAG